MAQLRQSIVHASGSALEMVDDIGLVIGERRIVSPGHDIENQLEFERLFTDLSEQFLNLPSEQLAGAIQAGVRRTGDCLDVDDCTLHSVSAGWFLGDPVRSARPGLVAPALALTRDQFPSIVDAILANEIVQFARVDDLSHAVDRDSCQRAGLCSSVIVPVSVGGVVAGALACSMLTWERTWTPIALHRLRLLGAIFGHALARRHGEDALAQALGEVQRLRDRVRAEPVYLRRDAVASTGAGSIVGESAAIRRVLEQTEQVAATDSTVLLLGETGTGKELVATRIHALSARSGQSMVRVNCAAIPSTLIESELFGREKGAFTGAVVRQIGRFELADRSTIFLDEIGDLPPDVQVKLLRVLEERQIERLGSPKSIHIDARIIAATHRNLERLIGDGVFREDLFYRLNVFPIVVPPLRERPEDIPLLVWSFVGELSRTLGKPVEAIARESMTALQQYSWPGNIRELRNAVERAMIVATGPRLTIAVPASSAAAARRGIRLVDVETDHIRRMLESVGWRIRGAGGAADRLGLKPTTLETRMQKLGIKRPRPAAAL